MLCLLLLPFQLMFGLLFLPFLLLRAVLKLLTALILLPIVLAVAVAGLVIAGLAFSFAVLLPLLPFAAAALVIWAIVKLAAHPAAA